MQAQNITINITGDFYLPSVEGWNFGSSLSGLLQTGDINVVNLEAPLNTPGAKPAKKSGPSLCQDAAVPEFLVEKAFGVINCANNHIFDYGTEALANTLTAFAEKAVLVGAGSIDDAYSIKIVEAKGIRIGFLALTQYEFGVHDDKTYSNGKLGAAWMCHPDVSRIIAISRNVCDKLIVMPHAGLEHFSYPLPELQTLYRHFVDMGADAVVASHPHVPQPCETYKGKPIFYSLGNFCFDMPVRNRPLWNKGLIAQLQINEKGVLSGYALPVSFDCAKKTVELSTDKQYAIHLAKINSLFSDEAKYLDAVNKQCLAMKPTYDMIFSMGGYHQVSSLRKAASLMKQQLAALIRRKPVAVNDAHFINSLRCETHRWVMSRIYELTNK